jgi:hypothetical protein
LELQGVKVGVDVLGEAEALGEVVGGLGVGQAGLTALEFGGAEAEAGFGDGKGDVGGLVELESSAEEVAEEVGADEGARAGVIATGAADEEAGATGEDLGREGGLVEVTGGGEDDGMGEVEVLEVSETDGGEAIVSVEVGEGLVAVEGEVEEVEGSALADDVSQPEGLMGGGWGGVGGGSGRN